jgi:hypothetical protein
VTIPADTSRPRSKSSALLPRCLRPHRALNQKAPLCVNITACDARRTPPPSPMKARQSSEGLAHFSRAFQPWHATPLTRFGGCAFETPVCQRAALTGDLQPIGGPRWRFLRLRVLSFRRPEGAATRQPRATPWVSIHPPSPSPVRAQQGRGSLNIHSPRAVRRASALASLVRRPTPSCGSRVSCCALTGRRILRGSWVPRALPWAVMSLPLRGEMQIAQHQNWRFGLVKKARKLH